MLTAKKLFDEQKKVQYIIFVSGTTQDFNIYIKEWISHDYICYIKFPA